jgi:hypothetical protein
MSKAWLTGPRPVLAGVLAIAGIAAIVLTAAGPVEEAEGSPPGLGVVLVPGAIDMSKDAQDEFRAEAFRAVAPTASMIRTSVYWKDVQKTCRAIRRDRYRWDEYDDIMRLFLEEGVERLVTVTSVPQCAAAQNDASLEPKPRYQDDFERFVRKVVERYGPNGKFFEQNPGVAGACCPVTHYEIWNEPNLGKKWTKANPSDYSRFFVSVAKAIHRADNYSRQVKVITGAVTGLNGGDWKTNGRAFVRGLYDVPGLKRFADRIGIHTYSPTAKQAMRNVRVVRSIMDKHGDHGPIEITEHGWSTCPRPDREASKGKCVGPRSQAKRMETLIKKLTAPRNRELDVRHFLWFMAQDLATRRSVRDCPKAPKNFFGFFDHAGDPKPSWSTWQNLTGVNGPNSLGRAHLTLGCKGKWAVDGSGQ